MAETREDDGMRNLPSIPVPELETPIKHKRRRISKEEGQSSWQEKRRRNRSVISTEETQVKWANIEANIEFPILTPRSTISP